MAKDEVASEAAADEEAGGVTQHGAGPHDPDERQQRDLALPGDHSADHHDRLAGSDQAHEGAGLQEREQPDQRVASTGRAPWPGPRSPTWRRAGRGGAGGDEHHDRDDGRGHRDRLGAGAGSPRRGLGRDRPPGSALPRRRLPPAPRRGRARSARSPRPGRRRAPARADRVQPRSQLRPQRQSRPAAGRSPAASRAGRRSRGQAPQRPGIEAGRGGSFAAGPKAVQLGVDGRRGKALLVGYQDDSHRRQRRPARPARRRPTPGRGGLDLARHVAAQAPRQVAQRRRGPAVRRPAVGRPQGGGGVGAATAEPRGHGDPLLDRHAYRRQRARAGNLPEGRAAARRPGSSPSTPGQTTPSRSAASTVSSSLSSIEANREHSGCRPSGPGSPTRRTRLTLAGALGDDHRGLPLGRRSARPSGPISSARRRSRPGTAARRGRPRVAQLVSPRRDALADRGRGARRERKRAGQRLSPMREAGVHQRRHRLGRRRRPCARATRARSPRSARGETRCEATRLTTRTSARELRKHRRGAVGLGAGPRREALAHLALHHRHPPVDRRQAARRCAAARWPPRHRAGWPRPWRATGSSRPRSSESASAMCRVALANGPSASAERLLRAGSISTTCRWPARAARYSDSTPRPPPTSSTTSAGRAPRRARSPRACCRRSGSSGPARGSAARRSAAACEARLARQLPPRSPPEHPRRRCSSTAASSSS